MPDLSGIAKCPTGISGFDAITGGGLPRNRPTLLCAGPGCGKTVFSMEFIVRGACEFDEPGVFVSFEERTGELADNFASLKLDIRGLQEAGKLAVESIQVSRQALFAAGDFDLEGLFIRIGAAVRRIGARRIVLDGVETLYSAIDDQSVMRSEFTRLMGWLKDHELTAIVTAERGDGRLTRHGFEEYISDCVISLDQRVAGEVATRRLQIVKYRGSAHGTNEYPFLIEAGGIAVLPVTEVRLQYPVQERRVATGIAGLDEMLGGGYYRGSTVLVSGSPGSGKSSIAARFAEAGCQQGEKAIYFAFEEGADQIIRNMRSIGIDLDSHRQSGKLRIHATRPSMFGLEMHLASMFREVQTFEPTFVVVDPISSFGGVSASREIYLMTMRMVDFFKLQGITALFTSVIDTPGDSNHTDVGISSMIDTWLRLTMREAREERDLYIIKSRGMRHSREHRGFVLTDTGIRVLDTGARHVDREY